MPVDLGDIPVTKTDPITAARRLREIFTGLVNGTSSSSANTARAYMIDARAQVDKIDKRLASIEELFIQVEKALRERKTAPGLQALKAARVYSNYAKESSATARLRLNAGMDYLPIDGGSGLGKNLQEAYTLVQCLPTQTDLPTTASENTLRAIVALLRHHKVKGAHEIVMPTENGEEVQDGKDLDQELVEAVQAEVKPATGLSDWVASGTTASNG